MNEEVKDFRKLPNNVIHESMLNSDEPNEMSKRFSSPDYAITHSNGDQNAFSYMNLEAKLYWLPKFMEFIRTAKHDGYVDQHIDTIMYYLSDRSWANEAKKIMLQDEKDAVAVFLEWIDEKLPQNIDPDFTYASYLWGKR